MENILITGAAKGIGRAFFKSLDPNNYENIVLMDRSEMEIQQDNIVVLNCDISEIKQVKKSFEILKSKNIKINIAVNCAGVPGPNRPFLNTKIEDLERVMDINFKGTFNILQEVIKDMTELGQGKILTIASVLARCGMSGSSTYSASKAAIIALSRSLAIEFAEQNIQINTISPGAVDTDFLGLLKKRVGLDTLKSIHPIKKISTAEEIAKYIKFIIEESTSFMTGVDIPIDGGYSAQ